MGAKVEVKFEVTETKQVYFGVDCSTCGSPLKATYSQRFDTVGSFDYNDPANTTMQGTINVVP